MELDLVVKGYWWLPSDKENKIAGILTCNGKDQSALELFGCFQSFNLLSSRKRGSYACELIYGITQKGEKFSLLNNIRLSLSASEYATCTFMTSIVIEGIHLDESNKKCFTGGLLSFKYLSNWYRKDTIEVQDDDDYQIFKCKCKGSNERTVRMSDGSELTIHSSYKNAYFGHNDEIRLYQGTQLILTVSKPLTVWEFLDKAKILQQLVSLLLLSPQYFDEMRLRTQGGDYYIVRIYLCNGSSVKPSYEAFLNYDVIKEQLDGIVKKWFECSDEMYPIQSHLIRSLDSSKSLGCEDFLAVAQAIDGITKISDSEKQFRKRVTNLYNRLKKIHRLQNNKVDINTFVNTRNYYAHMAKDKDYASVAKGLQLVELQQEAILLLTCTLLNFYGLSDCQIDESLEHSIFAGNFFLNMKGKDAVVKENN